MEQWQQCNSGAQSAAVFEIILDRIRAVMSFSLIMRKSILLTSTSLVGLLAVPPAFAADLPVKYQESQKLPWAGLYIGANAGYAWSSDPSVDCVFTGVSPCPAAFPAVRSAGPEYGIQAGYNWQVANWVLGFETDINKLAARGTSQFAGIDPGKGPDQLSTRYDWLGTARGRAGVTAGNALFYATGGLAYGRVSHGYNYDFTNGSNNNQIFSSSDTSLGWTAGGGVEYALGRNWSLKAEYLYVHLAASSLSLSGLRFGGLPGFVATDTTLRFNNNLNIVRLGANYRF
jgi:outer membrane immunogenic protein